MSDQNYRTRVPFYIGADGKRVTLADLPSGTHRRWLPRHKQIVLSAVSHGLLTFEEACERYNPTLDEYLSWQRALGPQKASRVDAGPPDESRD